MSQVISPQIRSWSVSQVRTIGINRILQMVPWKHYQTSCTRTSKRLIIHEHWPLKNYTAVFTICFSKSVNMSVCFSIIFKGFWSVSLLIETGVIFIPHSMSCGGYTVFDPSVSQSSSPSATPVFVGFFSSAQLLWNRSTNLVKLCSHYSESHTV